MVVDEISQQASKGTKLYQQRKIRKQLWSWRSGYRSAMCWQGCWDDAVQYPPRLIRGCTGMENGG